MDKGDAADLALDAERGKPCLLLGIQLPPGPLDRCGCLETEIAERALVGGGLVMVAKDAGTGQCPDNLEALRRIRVVTHHVTQGVKLPAAILTRIRKNGLERLQVGMDVTQDRAAHQLPGRGEGNVRDGADAGAGSLIRWAEGIFNSSSSFRRRVSRFGARIFPPSL